MRAKIYLESTNGQKYHVFVCMRDMSTHWASLNSDFGASMKVIDNSELYDYVTELLERSIKSIYVKSDLEIYKKSTNASIFKKVKKRN